MNVVVSPEFDRAIVTWVGAVTNEFMGVNASGSFQVTTAEEGKVYTIKVNGYEVSYTAIAGDTESTISVNIASLLKATSIGYHLSVTTDEAVISLVSTNTLYYLYIEEADVTDVPYTPEESAIILWENQNAYDPVADRKPMSGDSASCPFITISTIATTTFGKETLIVKDLNEGFDNRVDNSVSLRFKVTTIQEYVGLTDYIASSWSRRPINRLFLRCNGISCFGVTSKTDISALLNSMTELRYALDMRFNYVVVMNETDDDVGLIENIEINGKWTGGDPT